MALDFLILIVGGVLLYFGAEWLVSGAAGIARLFGITPLVIGLTVVSYGTSAPELAVSLTAAVEGHSAISLGNVIGSNIANIGLILGLTALVAPPLVDPMLIRREVPYLGIATLATVPVLVDGEIGRLEGAVLFAGAVLFTYLTFRWSKEGSRALDVAVEQEQERGKVALASLFVLGLVLLLGGGRAFVYGATEIAREFGISERVIGLTVVAFGTSLPELAASMVAAIRGHADMAVGNVVGSNLFNILLILGATSLIHPIEGDLSEISFDLIAMGVLTALMAVSMFKHRHITRAEGGVFVALYLAFLVAINI